MSVLKSKRSSVCMCVCVCEKECVCVCVCERETEDSNFERIPNMTHLQGQLWPPMTNTSTYACKLFVTINIIIPTTYLVSLLYFLMTIQSHSARGDYVDEEGWTSRHRGRGVHGEELRWHCCHGSLATADL